MKKKGLFLSVFLFCFLLSGCVPIRKSASGSKEEIKVKTIIIEGENYTRFDEEESIRLPSGIYHKNASNEKALCVKRPDVGGPSWVEYDFSMDEPGYYEIWVRVGGNNHRQAAFFSLDGNKGILVDDNPEGAIPLTPTLEELTSLKAKKLEESFRDYLIIENIYLKKGRHTLKIVHAQKPDTSNTFCLDKIEIRNRR